MARMPGAAWIGPTPNQRVGGMSEHRGLVLHIQDGTEEGSEAWFKNPDSQASSHFLNPKQGGLRQLVDTNDRAWTEAAGNAYWVSIENEGLGGDALTPSQIENCAQLLAWLHRTYDVPLQSTDDPNGAGLGWHGMGGAAWGGHYDCPGEPVKAQRPQILARAQQIINPAPTEEDDMPTAQEIADAVWNFQVPLPRLQPDGTVNSDQRQAAMWPLVWGNIWTPRIIAAVQAAALTPEKLQQALADGTLRVEISVKS